MAKETKSISEKIGLQPGSLIHIGERKAEYTRIELISYDSESFEVLEFENVEQFLSYRSPHKVSWINIDGLHDTEVIKKIGEYFKIHSLTMEDILNTVQRPKMDGFDEYIYIVLKMLDYDQQSQTISSEQLSLIIKNDLVISFQEKVGDVFDHLRHRIRVDKGRLRRAGADYLAYAILDSVVDRYFVLLEWLEDRTEKVEDQLINYPDKETLQNIYGLKTDLIFLKKLVWPLRDVITVLKRDENTIFQQSTYIYLSDVYDHIIFIIEMLESFKETVSGMVELYISSTGIKMNEVMKFLTIIATIFIPLTFIAGVYGMNFNNMPELKWHWGYHLVLILMLVLALSMIAYFKKQKWF